MRPLRPPFLAALLAASALIAWVPAAQAQGSMLDGLKQQFGQGGASTSGAAGGSATGGLASGLGLSMPSMGSSTMGNAAGVLQYCVQNNYLNAASANGVKDKLMGMVTGQKPQQTGYANGTKGMLMGSDGKSLNLQGLSGKLKEKACDYVLKNAGSLI